MASEHLHTRRAIIEYELVGEFLIHRRFIGVGYDVGQNLRDEERSVWQTKPEREQKEETEQSRWGFRGKTVWDFLQLLIVPLMLVAIGLVFSLQQDARQQRIENQRAEAERELAEQRAQDEALQAYLDQMSQLMLERKLLEAEPGDPVHTLAQARTSTAILSLDAEHNESVTGFLINSGLAVRSEASPRLLREIPLSQATLSDAFLPNADLSVAFLEGADLSHAALDEADLSSAALDEADLSKADLPGADLTEADLTEADLSNAFLGDADLSNAFLLGADLSHRAFLGGTDLSDAVLAKANLSGAVLNGADLSDAIIRGANFRGANFRDASGITNEELEQQARSLEGATMPNGQKYEDWLKSKGRKEDGVNE